MRDPVSPPLSLSRAKPRGFVPLATRNPGLAHGLRRLERRLTPFALALGIAVLAGMTFRIFAS